jgi:RHS repeat-associated protein
VSYRASDGQTTRQLYKPWGEPRYASGSLPTDYTYTGQYSHVSDFGLLFFVARWYDPALGRFSQPDTIVPDPGSPQAFDRFAYTLNNPVKYNDPTGHITKSEEKDAEAILQELALYGVNIKADWGDRRFLWNNWWEEGLWTLDELRTVLTGVQDLANAMGGADVFKAQLGGVTIKQKDMKYGGTADAHNVNLNAGGFSTWTVVHELAHAWDGANGWKLSKDMQNDLGAGFDHPILHFFSPNDPKYWYDPGQGPPPAGVDANFNRHEDFAEAVTAYVYPNEASANASARGWPYNDPGRGYNYAQFQDTPRGQYIQALMATPP